MTAQEQNKRSKVCDIYVTVGTDGTEGERRGLVVIAEDCRFKGRGIESRSFYFFYSFPNHREKKRKSTKVSRNEESRKGGSGEKKKKNRQAFQERDRGYPNTSPRGACV